jgi:predicted O-methyltransferase YrrM
MSGIHTTYPEIEGWTWEADLMHLRKRRQETAPLGGPILEIGSFCGLSTAILSENGTQVVCVDPFMGGFDLPVRDTYPIFEANMKRLGRFEQLEIHRMPSAQFFKTANHGRHFRLIFIDGSHDYGVALADIRASWPILKRGGYLIVDDANSVTVSHAVNDSGHAFRMVGDLKFAEARKL